MKKILTSLCLAGALACASVSEAADQNPSYPEWKSLGQDVMSKLELSSATVFENNPNGATIYYGVDKNSFHRHNSTCKFNGKDDMGIWVCRVVPTLNEIELTYTKIHKDGGSYHETNVLHFYMDGTVKGYEVSPRELRDISEDPHIAQLAQICLNNGLDSLEAMTSIPDLPIDLYKYQLKTSDKKMSEWTCFIDRRNSRMDPIAKDKYILTSLAFNREDRIYLLNETYFVKISPEAFKIDGSETRMFTYEDKFLGSKKVIKGYFLSDTEVERRVSRDMHLNNKWTK